MHIHGGDIYTHKDLKDFSANINPLGIPRSVVDAAIKGAAFSAQYPDVQCRRLKNAISEAEAMPKEQIVCGNGAADIIFSLALALKPQKALLLAPTFFEYEQALRAVDCHIDYYILEESGGFQLSEDYLKCLNETIDIVFICNPNNPTGTLIAPDFLEKVLQKCEEFNIFLVLDECFNDFLDEPGDFSLKECIKESKNLFILKAFTKLYAMAGLRLGYGFSVNQQLLKKLEEVRQPWSVSTPAQMAGIAALKEKAYVARTAKLIKKEREFLRERLQNLNLKVYASKANYIFFQAPEGLDEQAKNLGFMIRNCANYYGLREGYYRIAVRQHHENTALIEAFAKILK